MYPGQGYQGGHHGGNPGGYQGGYQGNPQGGGDYHQGGYPGGGYPQQPQQQWAAPPGPPPPQHYGGGGGDGGGYYQPPPSHHGHHHGAPPQQQQQQYAPPAYPPPSGLDQWGYPLQQQPGGHYQTRSGGGHAPPPTAPQEFGHGAPQGYSFQYSNCTGRRKALLIGINYFNQEGQLNGCINDVHNLTAFLMERYHYKREDMVLLTDDQTNPASLPTRDNILRAMAWLVKDAQPNDSLFLHYSGHGGQTEDTEGDEIDGYNEVIYPLDHKSAGHIDDDTIHDVVVRPLQAGVRLTAIFDSCHSGTVMDLPYVYSTKGVLKEPNLAAEAGKGLLDAAMSYARGDLGGVASSVFGLAKSAFRGDGAYNKTVKTRTSSADVIQWSGCKDAQTSADATIASKATGAMSWAFIAALKDKPEQSYKELLNSVRDLLEAKYTQKPQLSCSHPLDTDILFVM
jgi:hypothetical protein